MIRIPSFAKRTVREVSQTYVPEQYFDNKRMREISERVKSYKFLPNEYAIKVKQFYEEHKPIKTKVMKTKFDLVGGEKFLKNIKL